MHPANEPTPSLPSDLVAVLEGLGVALVLLALDGAPRLINAAARRLLSAGDASSAAQDPGSWLVPSPSAAAAGRTGADLWRELADAARFGRVEERHVHIAGGGGDPFPAAVTVSPVQGDGEVEGYAMTIRDLSDADHLERRAARLAEELEAARERWDRLALTDELTGLSNDRGFRRMLGRELKRAARLRNPLSLLLVEIEDAHGFAAEHGELAADELLKRLGRLLVANGRETDLVARYRGSEFAVLLPDTNRAGGRVWAERLRQAFIVAAWAPASIGLGVGIATQPPPPFGGLDASADEALLDKANRALRHARDKGSNRICHAGELAG